MDFDDIDPAFIKREREKARKLKKTQWWLTKLNQGICEYCGKKYSRKELTMDHRVPLARGGRVPKETSLWLAENATQRRSSILPLIDISRIDRIVTVLKRLLYLALVPLLISPALGNSSLSQLGIPSPDPTSPLLVFPDSGTDHAFCSKWNPDFSFRGGRCCGKTSWKYRRRGIKCNPKRAKRTFCDEMTLEQLEYVEAVKSGKIKDTLSYIANERQRREKQAYCTPNDGFLAHGRPLIPTSTNRVKVRRPARCVHFGTDEMVGMLDWVGRQIHSNYTDHPELRLLVGDISAPRGGCLTGRGGRRGHASHMTGQDVDLGFLNVKPRNRVHKQFSRRFEPESNWWLVKQIFKNPFVCIKRIFLDRRHIRWMSKVAADDPEWEIFSPYVRHIRRHRNHMHVRIGDRPGPAGCELDFEPLLVEEEEWDEESLASGPAKPPEIQ